MGACRIAQERFIGGAQRRVRHAEALFEPQMHPGLIADLHRPSHSGEKRGSAGDHPILCLEPEIGRIEIDKVEILDAMPGAAAGQGVPDTLVDRTAHQTPVGQRKVARGPQHAHQGLIGADQKFQHAPAVPLAGQRGIAKAPPVQRQE
ncbi:hypothetical protein GCM10007285_16230 [Stappia taiwanensis]|nr:hypothetical protein GCM10007285_16230 [Stappia taiwanensis]